MKYFKLLTLIFIFPIKLSHAIEFELAPSDQSGEVKYFLLQVKNDDEVKDIDVGLEGNANNVTIKNIILFPANGGRYLELD